MRVIFEGVDDGKDALATVAGLGHAILGEVGVRLEGLGSLSHLPKHPGPSSAAYVVF
jgi:hypothetical protein